MSTQEEMKAALRKHLSAGDYSWFGNRLDQAVDFFVARFPSSEEVERLKGEVERLDTEYEAGVERLTVQWARLEQKLTLEAMSAILRAQAAEATIWRLEGQVVHQLNRVNAVEARNTRLQALVGEMREALGPFAKVRTQDLADNSPLEISVCFNREEAEAMNADIDENGWPITKADIAKGTHFPRHSLAMDSVTVGDIRRAHAALQKSEASE